ncbi:3-(3-hydroxyphenyl)propionate hydroxylase [Actinomadura sp. NBRC 104425]|uniref:bifunctional 3-(3-hydroxy-phenyl)propionate/3-hydroxycinnamic acid hydroxylase MhpA n=1 Tax=Actinomadura sp. NBRC 104425 TaxID=3032204 RepID=UPI0024A209EC|nr:bifunctional 3-(3-hydroxy-phenyl)propionate/3-hydroxycinnamic acid hydroxylase [Actinomadura sp. NBRC 104425]GLZ09790.1 3-(3-hydroxyphenyl)propionate hydroxylase [Actinomadura sp. NBRC 104425]
MTGDGMPPEPGTVVPVLIAGAGPTGVTAATLLARYGVRSLTVDPHHDVYPRPRAVHLDDEVARILQRLGVAEGFAAISRPMPGMRLVDGRLRTIAEFRRDRIGGVNGWPQANLFDQPDLERLLRANLHRHALAELRGGTEVVRIEQTAHGRPAPVRVLLRDLATERTYPVWTHALLGCDGANSTVRQAIGARMHDLRFAERWLVVDVRHPGRLSDWDGVQQVCDPHRAATYMRVGEDRHRWEFRMRPGETEADLVAPEALSRLLAPWTGDVPWERLHLLRHAEYTFRAQVADRWRHGRVFILGDAAHLTPPFIGQGLGAGLRDAANLAWKLALVLGEGADERLLDTYQAERRHHVTRMIRLAVTVGLAMTGGQDRAASLRRLLLAGAARVPGFTDAALRTASLRLPAGPLVRRPRAGGHRHLAGTLVPQPWLTVDGRRRPADELLGESFAVLGDGPVHPALASLARRLGAPVVDVSAWPQARWMRRAGVGAVLVRPDRVVMATAPMPPRRGRPGAEIVRDAAAWLPLLPADRTRPTPSPTQPSA